MKGKFMELNTFFKSFIESEEEPMFICNLDYRIIYLNPAAAKRYKNIGGYDMIGKPLNSFISFEAQTKLDAVVEWFKESEGNNFVFVRHEDKDDSNHDLYVCALRDDNKNLIGFCNRRRSRIIDTNEPYSIF